MKGEKQDEGTEGLAAMAQAAMMTAASPSLPCGVRGLNSRLPADRGLAVVALTVTHEFLSEEVEPTLCRIASEIADEMVKREATRGRRGVVTQRAAGLWTETKGISAVPLPG